MLKVLYIAGEARSGSTLLELMLDHTLQGSIAVGEVSGIWDHAFVENQLCGCGRHFQKCEFWTAVIKESFGGWSEIDAHKIFKMWVSVSRTRSAPWASLFSVKRQFGYFRRLQTLAPLWQRIYESIQTVTGCKVIVDSSKVPIGGLLFNEMLGIDPFVLQLVRDSRAVAHSMSRVRVLPEVTSSTAYMQRFGPVFSALRWNIVNLSIEGFKRQYKHYTRLGYSELVTQPRESLEKIGEFIGEIVDPVALRDSLMMISKENHTVAGNHVRFQKGLIQIRLDDEWYTKMPYRNRLIVTSLTWPLLRHYGFV